MGRSDEPNMGLPILGIQHLVNYYIWVIFNYGWLKGKNGTPNDEGSY
jgi:hypothetical protein